MVVQSFKAVIFHVNAFSWKKGVPTISPLLTIFQRALLDYNFYFRAIHSDLTQDFEGTRNNVTPRATGYIALESNGSLYGCAK